MSSLYVCDICSLSFTCKKDFEEHNKHHKSDGVQDQNHDNDFLPRECDDNQNYQMSIKEELEDIPELFDQEYNWEKDIKGFMCCICNIFYNKESSYKRHIKKHHDDYICEKCGKQWKTRTLLARHQLKYSQETRFTCPKCNKGFKESGNLKVHLRLHNGERPFLCHVCYRGFTQKQHLVNHELVHLSDTPHVCEVCGKKFAFKQSLLKHHQNHKQELLHICPRCNTGFSKSISLHHHMLTHTGDEPYSCNICGLNFELNTVLKAHLETHSDLMCKYCGIGFPDEKQWVKHQQIYRHIDCQISPLNDKHECELCKRCFTSMKSLKNHSYVHCTEFPFRCDVCSRKFRRSTTLKNHYLIHTGEMNHQCPICYKCFARKNTLQNHLVLHTGERPFVCLVCKRDFNRKSALKSHMLTHEGKSKRPASAKKYIKKTFKKKPPLITISSDEPLTETEKIVIKTEPVDYSETNLSNV